MKKILGLDLGTTSIGWALVHEAESTSEQSEIIKLGVRVVPLSSDEESDFKAGKAITTNQGRRMARGARRGIQRYKQRRKNLHKILLAAGIINKDFVNTETGNYPLHESIRTRAKAATEQVTMEEFARVLFMINKKRGYKSSRKSVNDEETGEAINEMDVAIELLEKKLTPGQYAFSKLLNGSKKRPQFYKSDLENEFKLLWESQRVYHPTILTEKLYTEVFGKSKSATSTIFRKNKELESPDLKGEDRKLKPLQWRSDGLSNRLEAVQLVTVFADINNELNGSSGYLAEISDRSKVLYINNITVGQYLYQHIQKNPDSRLKGDAFYRKDYENEFDQIWKVQKQFYPQLNDELKQRIKETIIFYQRPLKSQKGRLAVCELEGKSKKVIVEGKPKNIVMGPKVAPKSSPLFQFFKSIQQINNLVIKRLDDPLEQVVITKEDHLALFEELIWKDKLTAKDVLDRVLGRGADKHYKLNFDAVEGNKTFGSLLKGLEKAFKNKGYDISFSKLNSNKIREALQELFESEGIRKDLIAFTVAEIIANPDKQPIYKLWHLLYSYEGDSSRSGDASLVEKLTSKFGFPTDMAKILAKVTFEQDHGNISAKAIKKMLPHLLDGLKYSDAAAAAGYNHSKSRDAKTNATRELKERLEILPKNSLRNPIVEKILNQMIHVVNAICDTYGKPDEIRLEMARELKMSADERKRATNAINDAKRKHDEIREVLTNQYGLVHISRNDIMRYKLYMELEKNNYHTLYSNQYIPADKLFTKEIDIEHIIPKSVLFDDSFSNKTLEFNEYNREKSDSTALDYVLKKYGETGLNAYKNRVNNLVGVISPGKIKKLLMAFDQIPDGFVERDLRNSQYIAKKAREILDEGFRTVNTTTGSITDRLRRDWQLIDVLKELNWERYDEIGMTKVIENRVGDRLKRIEGWTKRDDHRHHAMDALTTAFTRYEHVQYLNYMSARKNPEHKKANAIRGIEAKHLTRDNKNNKLLFAPPMPLQVFRKKAKEHLSAVLISFKAKNKVVTPNTNVIKTKNGVLKKTELTPRGQLHKETVYGKAHHYVTQLVKIDGKMDLERAKTISKKRYREAVIARLAAFENDPKKAFTGKNALTKNPIWLNAEQTFAVPDKVKLVQLETIYTINKPLGPDIKVKKVIDAGLRKYLETYVKDNGGSEKAAFANLDEKPVFHPQTGKPIKTVKITGITSAISLHPARNHKGETLRDTDGQPVASSFVQTGNNHHVAIYKDADGNLHERVVSFYEAVERARQNVPIVDKQLNRDEGWQLLFTLKQNEYFVLPNEDKGFDPSTLDLIDPENASKISPQLFRVQSVSTKDYFFCHHLETQNNKEIRTKGITWERIRSLSNLFGCIKVRVNHLGKIEAILND